MGLFLQSSRRPVLTVGGALTVGAALALAAAGCDGARAQGTTPPLASPPADGAARLAGVIAVPADWRPLPTLVAAGARAAGAPVAVAAWGEPGLGCFAVVVAAHAGHQHPEDAVEEVRVALTAGFGLDGWTATDPTDLHGRLVRGPLRGELRGGVTVAPPTGAVVTMAACFYNQRDPVTCAALCQGVLATLDASKVKP